MTVPTVSAALQEERSEPPFHPAPIEEMLRLLGRAVRARQLYLPNNPTYLRALDNLKASFTAIWSATDELTFDVSDTQLRWEGTVVLNEPDKTGDALPWVLYKDGVRELVLLRGVEQQEVVALVGIIARVRKAAPDEDDLLTLLWEQEFAHVRYRYVDLMFEGAAELQATPEEERPRLVDPMAMRESPQEDIKPPGVVNLDDFDSTLYFLDESEVEYLRTEIQRHYTEDLRTNVVTILLDIFEQQPDPNVRDEICTILDSLLVHLLSAGHLRPVAFILREVNVAANRARDLTPGQRELLLSLPNRMSEPDTLAQFIQSLDERADLPPQDELNELFEQMRIGALGTLFAWLHRVQAPRVRKLLEATADRLASSNVTELVRLIGASERAVALEAVRRAGTTKAAPAVAALARLLAQGDAEMRLAAVQSLSEIGSPGAMQQLERAIEDSERDVRVASARALATRAHRPAVNKLEKMIIDKRLLESDLTEKMAFFEAYGSMCGDGGVSLLDGYLNGKGLFGKRGDAEVRACAALALGRIASEPAFTALRRATSDREVLVRNAVNRALRGAAS